MLVDARQVSGSKTIRADICVVGAGAAGISFAMQFINTSVRVCLLEGGGFDFDEATQSLNEGEIQGRAYHELVTARQRFFGGTTNHWTGWCRPLDEIDFEMRPFIPNSGWPISLHDLTPHYLKANQLCELEDFTFRVEDYSNELPKFYGERLRDNRAMTTLWKVSPPTRFGIKYRNDIVQAGNIHTYLNANVVEIETNEQVSTVTRLRVATLNGKGFAVEAKVFVLASGGIEVPRLLLSSNSRNPAGLGNDHDQVGRFFMLHPHLWVGRILMKESSQVLFERRSSYGSQPIPPGIRVSPEKQRVEGLPNHVILLRASSEDTPEGVEALRRLLRGGESNLLEDLWTVLTDLGPVAEKAYNKLLGRSELTTLHVLLWMDHMPNPDSRVKLSSMRDALGMPRVVLDWRLRPEEKRAVRRTVEIIGQVLGALDVGRLQLDDWLRTDDDRWPEEIEGDYHHMGATRMSSDPRHGVVDANCRVHGLSNLFVASSSVFPTAGSANPTLTIVALALRLADHIKQVLKASS